MTHSADRRSSHPRRALVETSLGLIPLLLVSGINLIQLELPVISLVRALVLYGALAALLLRHLPSPLVEQGLGPANRITLLRATFVVSLAAVVPYAASLSDTGLWWVVALAGVSLALDGVDGWLARRSATATPFGARFDMELDAFLMLVLACLVWRSGRLDWWVLLLGVPRYAFVAAGWRCPWLSAPLPERLRRKTGCVIQGIALLVCLIPIVSTGGATAVAVVTLGLLLVSFGIDVLWLARHQSKD